MKLERLVTFFPTAKTGLMLAVCAGLLPDVAAAETGGDTAPAAADGTGPCPEGVPVDVLLDALGGEQTLAPKTTLAGLADEVAGLYGDIGQIHVELRLEPVAEGATGEAYRVLATRMIACRIEAEPQGSGDMGIGLVVVEAVDPMPSAVPDSGVEDNPGLPQSAVSRSPRPMERPEIRKPHTEDAIEKALAGGEIANQTLAVSEAELAQAVAAASWAAFFEVRPRPEPSRLALGPYVVVRNGAPVAPEELAEFKRLILETPGAFLSSDLQKTCRSAPEYLVQLSGGSDGSVVDAVISLSCNAIGFVHNKSTPSPKHIYYYDPIEADLRSILREMAS